MNSFKVTLLILLMTFLFVGVGYALGGQNGMIIAFCLAAVMNIISYWHSDKIILRMYKAREVNETNHRRLYSIVSLTSQEAMIPMPKVYILPQKGPNAFATGRNENHAAVAVTEGLLEILTDNELKGVIGHELAHIQNKDLLIGTIAATLAAAIGILASIARWSMIFGGHSRGSDRGGSPVGMLIAMIVAPLAAMLIQMAISRSREYKADACGAQMTSQYQGLASALEKIHKSPNKMNLDSRPEMAHLFIANPLSGRKFTSLFSTHPPVEKRIERLLKLESGGLD